MLVSFLLNLKQLPSIKISHAFSALSKEDAQEDYFDLKYGLFRHHGLDGHGFGQTLGVGDGQGGLACCSSWGRKESDTTERLNLT